MDEQLRQAAIEYHRAAPRGKVSVQPTKGLTNQRDLALAYSPGVAAACELIVSDPREAGNMTSRGNLVAVVTNGTAVLGLGNIGPLAGKPVMEGKGCLFKKFAGIDVFDIEISETDPDRLVDIIASLEPTFGGINLEDIKAPECFYIERKLRERMKIPVFHDDQHGTAIIVAAAVLNGLQVVGKDIGSARLVGSGAGAAMIACLDLLVKVGLAPENITISDSKGVVYTGRSESMDPSKARYARPTEARTLADIMDGADIFLGLSTAGVLRPEMVERMARDPLILALANPEPEIRPEAAKAVRPDAIIATGRSDYPNQVNNVLCFPFIFRGALDVGATAINEDMKIATVHALAELAQEEQSDVVATAYGDRRMSFGPDYLIPNPFDPRLIVKIAPAVAKAAMDSGIAATPIPDLALYRQQLTHYVYRTGMIMRPVFSEAKEADRRVIYAEGEDERVLRAVQVAVDEGLARPVLVGRPDEIAASIRTLGLRIRPDSDFELVDPTGYPLYEELHQDYYRLMERKGISTEDARLALRRNRTLIGAMLMRRGEADAMLCGTSGAYGGHLRDLVDVIGMREDAGTLAAMNALLLPDRTIFVCDTYVNADPDAGQIAAMTLLAASEVRRFGLIPRVALLSHSSFGTADTPSSRKMRTALGMIRERAPDLEIEGEMPGDAALSLGLLKQTFPNARLTGDANLLIMPSLDAANISFNMVKMVAGGGITVGPILLGLARPAHILTPTASVRRIVNMTALAAVKAAGKAEQGGAAG
ncbi:NADP-dependent malic enzyme [Noviherbaspirillum aridicola]|uniref:Malic enzyme n=1 Tax=Noviherbaspirillum aridicola TaxID=2849687 RepID=A0ABQ4PZ32_9BURK|nr:NADP-dependent malic enzyme [Noviherbaspirillum aridicola]GIZ50148.1 malic enzyme [Noviherbaspirillum aridicola]